MENKYRIGFEVRKLSNLCKRKIDNQMAKHNLERLTGMQGRVIGYLSHNSEGEIFQKDIESEFSIRRSTATAILQTMEKHGFIVREPSKNDARMKIIKLTEKSKKRFKIFDDEINRTEALMLNGISKEEIECFLSTINKIKNNLGE